jgi:hypothetical protein
MIEHGSESEGDRYDCRSHASWMPLSEPCMIVSERVKGRSAGFS